MTESKKPSESQVEMTEMVLPQHTNALGTVFGGVIMSWVDIAAAICAQRHSARIVVTASIDAMHFLAPIKLGWVVNIKASINYACKTSCEIGVKIMAENPVAKESHHTASAYVTMVALNDLGKPTSVPAVTPETQDEKRRYDEAIQRREIRLKLKEEQRKRFAKEDASQK